MDLLVELPKKKRLIKRCRQRFKNMPNYLGLKILRVGYDQVQSWQGQDMRHMLRFLTVLVAPRLNPRLSSKRGID